MKRFYKDAAARPAGEATEILLDGRPVRTPMRQPLVVPTPVLAEAIAQEWRMQAEDIDPRAMPLTGLTNAAIDRIAPDARAFAAGLAKFGETDLLCYRADGPAALVSCQAERWDPLLVWGRRRFDVDFEVTSGILHRPQPAETVQRLGAAVMAHTPFQLAGLAPLVTISGSLIIALALAERAIALDAAWAAAALDEVWQAERWGEDAEAARVLERRRREFDAGYRFLELLDR